MIEGTMKVLHMSEGFKGLLKSWMETDKYQCEGCGHRYDSSEQLEILFGKKICDSCIEDLNEGLTKITGG